MISNSVFRAKIVSRIDARNPKFDTTRNSNIIACFIKKMISMLFFYINKENRHNNMKNGKY